MGKNERYILRLELVFDDETQDIVSGKLHNAMPSAIFAIDENDNKRKLLSTNETMSEIYCSRQYVNILCKSKKIESIKLPSQTLVFLDSAKRYFHND